MITWPTSLPYPATLSGKTGAAVVRTEMESGLIRQRLRFNNEAKEIPVSWSFDETEFMLFQTFFRDVLKYGTLYFNISLPNADGSGTYSNSVVRFQNGTYSDSYKDFMTWNVSATMERYIAPVVDQSYLIFIYDNFDPVEDFLEFENLLHNLVHVVIPEKIYI